MIGPQNGSRWASHSAGSPPHGSSSTLISAFCDHWTICARSSAALCRRCGCSQLHLTDVNCSRKAAAASITFIFYARRKLFAVQKHCVKLVIWLVAGHLLCLLNICNAYDWPSLIHSLMNQSTKDAAEMTGNTWPVDLIPSAVTLKVTFVHQKVPQGTLKLTVLRNTDRELRQSQVSEFILYNDLRFTVMDNNQNEHLVDKNSTLMIRCKYEGKKDSN